MMWKDIEAYNKQDSGFGETGMGKIVKRNMLSYLMCRRYPITL